MDSWTKIVTNYFKGSQRKLLIMIKCENLFHFRELNDQHLILLVTQWFMRLFNDIEALELISETNSWFFACFTFYCEAICSRLSFDLTFVLYITAAVDLKWIGVLKCRVVACSICKMQLKVGFMHTIGFQQGS